MSDNEFSENMVVCAVGILSPGNISDSCEICPHNKSSFPGVLIAGVTKDAVMLLSEKVEIVPEGTTERLKNLEGINDSLVSAIKAVPGKPITEDWVFAEVEKGIKAFSEKYKELKASNAGLLEALKKLVKFVEGSGMEFGRIHREKWIESYDVMENARQEIQKAKGSSNE
jgi:hypothetical protein